VQLKIPMPLGRACFLLAVLSSSLFAEGPEFRFRRYDVERGISQSNVYGVLQDRRGFIWFGTQDGLNRFDGEHFKIFRPIADDARSLSSAFILALAEDRDGRIWLGTDGGGLNVFDPVTERFSCFRNNPRVMESLSADRVSALLVDKQGRLWVGTPNGLDLFLPATGTFIHFRSLPREKSTLGSNAITCLVEDVAGVLWVGTDDGGLNKLDPRTGRVVRLFGRMTVNALLCPDETGLWLGTNDGLVWMDRTAGRIVSYQNDRARPDSLSPGGVTSLLRDRSGHLWIGTRSGLDQFDPRTAMFIHHRNDPLNPDSLGINSVSVLFEDRTGGIWVGTGGDGLNYFSPAATAFGLIRDTSDDPNVRKMNGISSFYEDASGLLWIGTDGGLVSLDRRSGRRTEFVHDPQNPASLSVGTVRTVLRDHAGVLWAGTDGGGLNRFDPAGRRFVHFRHDPNRPESLASDTVRCAVEDNRGEMWVATFGGLDRFDRAAGRFEHFRHEPGNPASLSDDRVYTLFEDRSGAFWVGTLGGGLDRFDRAAGRFEHFRHEPGNPASLGDNFILSIREDESGVLWVGTRGGGLCRMKPDRTGFITYGTKDGFPNDVIYAILTDSAGNLWLTHNRGLSRFTPQTGAVKTFDLNDGLQSLEFNANACLKSRGGEMLFGGIKGANVFFPEAIKSNPIPPPVVISGLQVFGRPVPIGPDATGRAILDRSVVEADRVLLSYKDRAVTFEFAALDYTAPDENEYAYRLEKLETNWNRAGNRRFATYANLPPGRYVFRVKASNKDGVWNEKGASLVVLISPPFWKRLWFQAIALLAVLGALAGAARFRTRRLVESKKRLEAMVEERTTELRATAVKIQAEVAERRRAEEALREEKLRLDLLVDSAPEGIVVVDQSHLITRVNGEFVRLFGYAVEEVVGRNIDDVVSSPETKAEAEGYTADLSRGKAIVFEGVRSRKDGTPIFISGVGAPIRSQGQVLGYFAIYRDITRRKRAEEALHHRAAQAALINRVGQRVSRELEIGSLLQEIVDAVHETFRYHGVMLLLLEPGSNRLRLEAIAGGYRDVFGKDLSLASGEGMIGNAALQGKSLMSNDVAADPFYVRKAAEVTRSELSVPIRSGSRLIGVLDIQDDKSSAFDETDVSAMETLSAQIGSAIANARLYSRIQEELAERTRMEMILQSLTDDLVRSNKELEQFAYVASHDLQEPLRMVASYVQLLARRYRGKIDADADDFIHYAVDGATRMQNMINDLLAYSRVGTRGKPFVPADFESVLNRALLNLQVAIAETRAAVSHDPLPTLTGDETQLIQLFQNLIGNAVKFQDRTKGEPIVHIGAVRRDGEWLFSVRDNGIGIEPQYRERIFRIFERLHRDNEYAGTGIGLALCQRIVERHGGRIWVESEPGQGSTFLFTVPEQPPAERRV
jgi:PAS domain S-box-containing protein